MPYFSLIIATLDRIENHQSLLQSLKSQSVTDFEVIIVDQNPHDTLKEFISDNISDINLVYLHTKKSLGLSAARNYGLKHASGDVVAFPDDDCWYQPDSLEIAQNYFNLHPGVDCITGLVTDVDGSFSAGGVMIRNRQVTVSNRNVWWTSNSSAIFIRRKILEETGLFDTKVGLGSKRYISGEETDLVLRIFNKSFNIKYFPELNIFHKRYRGVYDKTERRRGYGYGLGMGYVLKKNGYRLWNLAFYAGIHFGKGSLFFFTFRARRALFHYAQAFGRIKGYFEYRPQKTAQKRVLLISPQPLEKTGRGMDVLSFCFDKSGWDTEHLQFPYYIFSNKGSFKSHSIVQRRAKMSAIPYLDGFMSWFSGPLFKLMTLQHRTRVRKIDFRLYDLIIIESGKPLFLLDSIPEDIPILYRQSDSVKMVLGRGKHYCALEDKVSERAEKILLVKDYYKKSIPEEQWYKTRVIRNGYNIPKNLELESPYSNDRKRAVYVGLTPLDPTTLDYLSKKHQDVDFHIFGPCIRGNGKVKKLQRNSNFYFYGYTKPQVYLAYLKYADLAIFPFMNWHGMENVGFTTKFLNYMYYGLPIITYKTGDKSEFEPYGIVLADDKEDFSDKIYDWKKSPGKKTYDVDWDFFSSPAREQEYMEYISHLEEDMTL